MSASHFRLGNLTVLVDNNHMQADGATADVMTVEPVVERFASFGFDASRIDGHDHVQLEKALPRGATGLDRPQAVVLETVPGKGVPTFERHHKVHYLRLEAAYLARRNGRARDAGGPKLRRGNEDVNRTLARNPARLPCDQARSRCGGFTKPA